MTDKDSLRQRYREKRKAVSPAELTRNSKAIANQLCQWIKPRSLHCIHTFLPIARQKEVDTWLIMDKLSAIQPGIQWVISRTDFSRKTMKHLLYEGRKQVVENAQGIPEPWYGEPIEPDQLEMVLIPLLAYDKQGNRLGYGQGFYDRFLQQLSPNCLKAGLSLFPPETAIPIDEHDQRLDLCITPEQIFNFSEKANRGQ